MTIGKGVGKAGDLAFKHTYFPTVEACWDYGIARNAPLLPFIGSLLPYNFLRGVQFDTKVFKLAEFLAAGVQNLKQLTSGLAARNEVYLVKTNNKTTDLIRNLFAAAGTKPVPLGTTFDGSPIFTVQTLSSPTEGQIRATLFATEEQYCIAVDGDSDLTANITSKWGGGEDMLTQIVQGIAQVAKNINEWGRTIDQSQGKNEIVAVPFSPMRYQGTDFGTITLNFSLFTRNDYIRDIHEPLSIIKSWCIPASSDITAESLREAASNKLDKKAEQLKEGFQHEAAKLAKQALDNDFIKQAAGFADGRIKVVEPPPTFIVRHNSRLFFMKKAAITSFTFKPEGPWVRVEYDGVLGKALSALGQSNMATALDRLLQDVYVKFPSYPAMCFPTRVKCSITLQETDFITADDYFEEEMGMFSEQVTSALFSALTTDQMTANIVAGGIAQNLDILIPDIKGAGDLLSGGKWVPPGESMSGIPGFL